MAQALFSDLVINGELVPHAAVAAEVQNHNAPKGKPGIAWRKAAQAVAIRTLLLQEARRRGMNATPAERSTGRFESPEEALIQGLLEADISVDTPTEEAIRAEWARDPSRFRAPPLWEVSHILIACDPQDEAERSAALVRAQQLITSASVDARSFARTARENSDCGSAASGGALGQLRPGDTVPEFEAVLRLLDAETVTREPVLTGYGWHIIRMDAKAEGAVLPFDRVRGAISTALEKAAWSQAAKQLVDGLVASARITGVNMAPIGDSAASHVS